MAACASGRWSRWHRSPRIRSCDSAIPHSPTRLAQLGEPADPQRRDPRRQSPAAAALLVFPLRRHFVACAKAAVIASQFRAKTSTTRFSTTCLARSSIPRRPRRCWWRSARRSSSPTPRAPRAGSRLEDFFVPPNRDMQRENISKPHEILDRDPPAAAAGERPHGAHQARRKGFVRLAARRCRRRARSRRGRRCRRAAIVLGAAAPVPHRAKTAEAALVGQRIDESTAARAARAALDGATPLAKNAYKLPLFEALVRRAIIQGRQPRTNRRKLLLDYRSNYVQHGRCTTSPLWIDPLDYRVLSRHGCRRRLRMPDDDRGNRLISYRKLAVH